VAVLPRRFYARPVLDVARDLLGRELVWRGPEGILGGVIVEVEAYAGERDPASHAARGETARNRVMFGPPGHAYVYFTYGMHHCMNVVTGRPGVANAVLIRALRPSIGLAHWRARRPDLALAVAGQGPGRVARALGLTRGHDGLDLTRSSLVVRSGPRGGGGRRSGVEGDDLAARIRQGPRVGIRVGRSLPWRFWIADEPAVSRARGSAPGPWPGARKTKRATGRSAGRSDGASTGRLTGRGSRA
jgi:DNA-3-methyladenine glycosylase